MYNFKILYKIKGGKEGRKKEERKGKSTTQIRVH